MKRVLAAVAAAASLALLATGCGSSGSSGSSGSGSKTITMWARDNEKGFINLLAAAWNKDHSTKVKVTIIPASNFVQKFGTAAASGSGPDVASIDLVYAPYFASAGALADISSVAKSLSYKDQLSPAHVKLGTYQGKTYALPFTAEASVMYYNKALFTKAGLDPNKPPTTYAEMLADAQKIRAIGPDTYGFTMAGSCGGCNVFEFTPHVWASGGDVLSADGKKAELTSPEVTDALSFYQSMAKAGVMPPAAKTDDGTAQSASFQAGKVGMVNLGAFFLQTLKTDNKVDFGVAPIAGKDGGSASFAGGDEIAVPTGSKNKAAAQQFVKWATDTEAQTILAKNSITPVRLDLLPSIYYPQDPRLEVFGKALQTGHTPYSTVENAVFNDNNGAWAKMINTAVFGAGDVKTAQASAQTAAQAILSKAKG
jgi:multiple sugar transport system substrate-binding protein